MANPTSEIAGLQLLLKTTMTNIDQALDRGDRRAFRAWSRKWTSLSARAGSLLVDLVTAET